MIQYVTTLKTRITDINYGGHVGHTELINLLHEVRVQWLKENSLNELDINGCALIMRQLMVNYLGQVFWDNELKIDMKVTFHLAKILFHYTVHNLSSNTEAANAEMVMVLLDKEKHKPTRINVFADKFFSA